MRKTDAQSEARINRLTRTAAWIGLTDAQREAVCAQKNRPSATAAWIALTDARRRAEKLIGKRGWRAVEETTGDARRATATKVARKYRRARVRRLTDAVAAVDVYRFAYMRWHERRKKIERARSSVRHCSVHPSRRGTIHDRLAWRRAEVLRCDRRDIWGWLERGRRLEGSVTHGEQYTFTHWVVPDWDEWRSRSRAGREYPPRDQHVSNIVTPYIPPADLPGCCRVIGGMLTIEAARVEHESADVTAWRARWLRHGRGYAVVDCNGYIAQVGAVIAHGETLAGAVRTARRRLKPATKSGDLPIGEYADIEIDWAAAKAAGMCTTGIESWVARHFPALNPRRDSVTVRQALATSTAKREVMAVCRYVARRAARAGADA